MCRALSTENTEVVLERRDAVWTAIERCEDATHDESRGVSRGRDMGEGERTKLVGG